MHSISDIEMGADGEGIEEGLARCTDSRDAHFSKFQLVFNN